MQGTNQVQYAYIKALFQGLPECTVKAEKSVTQIHLYSFSLIKPPNMKNAAVVLPMYKPAKILLLERCKTLLG